MRETRRRPRYRVVTSRTFDKRATPIHPERAKISRTTSKYSYSDYSDYERCFSDARRFSQMLEEQGEKRGRSRRVDETISGDQQRRKNRSNTRWKHPRRKNAKCVVRPSSESFFPSFFRVTVPKEISRYTRNFTGQFRLTTSFATLPRVDLTRSMARRGIQIGANFNYEPDRRISENLDNTNVPLSNVRPHHFCKL